MAGYPWDPDYKEAPVGRVEIPTSAPTEGAKGPALNPWDEGYDQAPLNSSPIGGGMFREKADQIWSDDKQEAMPTMKTPRPGTQEQIYGDIPAPNRNFGDTDLLSVKKDGETQFMVTPRSLINGVTKLQAPVIDDEQLKNLNDYEKALRTRYEHTGEKQIMDPEFHIPGSGFIKEGGFSIKGSDLMPDGVADLAKSAGIRNPFEIRVQPVTEDNGAFDPSQKVTSENYPLKTTRYRVPPPDQGVYDRIVENTLKDVLGGTGDFLGEGKLLTEGTTSKSLPNTPAQSTTEDVTTLISTLAVGHKIGGKSYDEAVKLISKMGTTGQTIADIAAKMSPDAIEKSKMIYQRALGTTGDHMKALKAVSTYTKNIVAAGALGINEAVVSPDGMQGIVSPDWLAENFNMSPERAKDMSYVLDSPIISSSLGLLGAGVAGAYNKFIKEPLGGIRNFKLAGMAPANLVKVSDKEAGLRLFTWLDPELMSLPPEQAAINIKMLGDKYDQHAQKLMSLAGAKKLINLDTPQAWMEFGKDYFDSAYAYRKEFMSPEEYQRFVSTKAAEASNRLLQLRTAIKDNQVQNAAVVDLMDMISEGANKQAGGDYMTTMGHVSDTAKAEQEAIFATTQGERNLADQAVSLAEKNYGDVLPNNPMFNQATKAEHNLGSTNSEFRANQAVADKLALAHEEAKNRVRTAYEGIGATGAEGDPVAFLEKLKQYARNVTPGHSFTPEELAMRKQLGAEIPPDVVDMDPFLKNLAKQVNDNPSYDNMYNSVRNQIQKELGKTSNQERRDMLKDIKKHIEEDQLDFVKSDDPNIGELIDNAKKEYQDYRSAFPDEDKVGLKAFDRVSTAKIDKEKFSKGIGPGQGVDDQKLAGNEIIKNSINAGDDGTRLAAIQRASEHYGFPVENEIKAALEVKTLSEIGNRWKAGEPMDSSTFRQAFSKTINGLENTNHPMAAEAKKVAGELETLELTVKDKKELSKQTYERMAKFEKDFNDSTLASFLHKGEKVEAGTAREIVKGMFNEKYGIESVKELQKTARELGEDGDVINRALKSSVMMDILDNLPGGQKMGYHGMEDGDLKPVMRISLAKAKKMFEGKKFEVYKQVFKDDPDVLDELAEIKKQYERASVVTPSAGDKGPLHSVPRADNPELALGTLNTLIFGTLNPTGAKVRRLTGPMAVDTLENVRATNAAAVDDFVKNPKRVAERAEHVAKGIENTERTKEQFGTAMRGAARNLSDWTSKKINDDPSMDPNNKYPDLKQELDRLGIKR